MTDEHDPLAEQTHYFIVAAKLVDGKPFLRMEYDTIVDPQKPVWDDESQSWCRVDKDNEDLDERLHTAVNDAIEDHNNLLHSPKR